jgi:hypothetical protein
MDAMMSSWINLEERGERREEATICFGSRSGRSWLEIKMEEGVIARRQMEL